ncbi:hypothetical protein [Altererythrobacter sp. Root672]|uniref:hypothetical protein n=1 Tax=Altererythrobacter sp. Root672 TaxID=1736584 RepID=UPI0006FE1E18|nr:hypothetical protein [Altererythrobacter sp. Root672]KRA83822.1 hypothetical protein ASD76_07345 [Altererythrobacter sp. Root672]
MDIVLSLVMLATLVLIGGAIFLWRKGGAQKQVWLMLLLAVVMIVNLLIWILPDSNGTAPVDRAAEATR